MNWRSDLPFDRVDFALNVTVNGAAGAVKAVAPGGSTIIDATAGGSISALSDLGHGKSVDGGKALRDGIIYGFSSKVGQKWDKASPIPAFSTGIGESAIS